MSRHNGNDERQEIIIVRRPRYDDHDDGHGGVWKVAFADFMTAMMAFFLVLWIVNASSKETRSSVARYFNPIQLSNTTPARKGLYDAREIDFDASGSDAPSQSSASPSPMQPITEEIRADAGNIRPGTSIQGGKIGKPDYVDRAHGEKSWRDGQVRETDKRAPSLEVIEYRDPFKDIEPRTVGIVRDESPWAPTPIEAPKRDKIDVKADADVAAVNDNKPAGKLKFDGQVVARQIATNLNTNISSKNAPRVEVEYKSDRITINLMDRADFAMFDSGSEAPTATTVAALRSIAAVVRDIPGGIVVRGHTDSAPFRSDPYGNWALSVLRARASQEILMKNGLLEKRFESVAGHADRNLKNINDRLDPQNRRIEILLRLP